MDRTCPHCGETFKAYGASRIYCSHRCAALAAHERRVRVPPEPNKVCPHCGTAFVGRSSARYCSRRCAGLATVHRSPTFIGKGVLAEPKRRTCIGCQTEYLAVKTGQRYCTDACRRAVGVVRDGRGRYLLSDDEYDAMAAQQGRLCAVCRREPKGSLVVDHDHETGRVRGLLCPACNMGLGLFKDDHALLSAAITYLKEK